MDFLDREFQKFPDHRAGNALRYDLADILKSAFAMFSLKAPIANDFKKRTEPERNNVNGLVNPPDQSRVVVMIGQSICHPRQRGERLERTG